MKLDVLTQLNADRAARKAVILITDTETGDQRLIRADDIAGSDRPELYGALIRAGRSRPLKEEEDFCRFAGRRVLIRTHRSVEGRRKISGNLEGIQEGIVIVILEDGRRIQVPVEDISSARLDYEFPAKGKGK